MGNPAEETFCHPNQNDQRTTAFSHSQAVRRIGFWRKSDKHFLLTFFALFGSDNRRSRSQKFSSPAPVFDPLRLSLDRQGRDKFVAHRQIVQCPLVDRRRIEVGPEQPRRRVERYDEFVQGQGQA